MNNSKQPRLINIALGIDAGCFITMTISGFWLVADNPESTPFRNIISIFFAILFVISLIGIIAPGVLALFAVLAPPLQWDMLSMMGIMPIALAVFLILAIVWSVLFVRCT